MTASQKIEEIGFLSSQLCNEISRTKVLNPPAPDVVSKPSTGLTALHLLLRKGEHLQFIQVTGSSAFADSKQCTS